MRSTFATMREAYQATWWLPAGELRTNAEAKRRLAHLRSNGPSELAFTFTQPFPAPGQPSTPVGDDWFCPS